jgi:PilZ domain
MPVPAPRHLQLDFALASFSYSMGVGYAREVHLAESDRRIYPRLKVPMLWRSPGVVAKFSRTVNMSLGGARVFSDDRLKLGTKLNIELLPDPDNSVQVLARVVWIDELGEGAPARYDVGLEFLDVPEEMVSRLGAILQRDEDYKRQLEAPAPRDPVWDDEEAEEEEDEKKQ